jgi:GDP-L-fucose synthase
MKLDSKIYIAGHRGLVGSNLYTYLKELGHTNLITRTSSELDLRNQQEVNTFFELEKPEYVFLAAAKDECHPCKLCTWCKKITFPRFVLYLS